jgi:carbon-monoxide dehydrogenase small subunit
LKKELIELRVNGRRQELAVEPSKLLLDVLREDLKLTGSKRGCDDSSCGACTVLLNGVPVLSCTMLAGSCASDDQEITTIEGVAEHGALAAIQKAYGDWGGAQCGYCTPGFLLAAKALLDREPAPDRETIRRELSGNLCRCTGYLKIYEAVELAARDAQEAPHGA